jgi:hypothetical protein
MVLVAQWPVAYVASVHAGNEKLAAIRARVEAFAASFPMPGFEVDELRQP